MRQKSGNQKAVDGQVVKDIRCRTRKQNSAEEMIKIVLVGPRADLSITELCRRDGTGTTLNYLWSKELLEAGKRHLAGDTARPASSLEIKELRAKTKAIDGRTL